MIAPAKAFSKQKAAPKWHAMFTTRILPAVRRHAALAFRHLGSEARAEAVAEAVAAATEAYVGLVKRHRQHLAFPSTMAKYAVCHVRNGRHVGGHESSVDVLAEKARKRRRFTVETLDHFDQDEEVWLEALVEDKHATPADLAASRVDVGRWFDKLPSRDRKIAEALAVGGSTGEVARQFHVSPGRISQKRREYQQSWEAFQNGEYGHNEGEVVAA